MSIPDEAKEFAKMSQSEQRLYKVMKDPELPMAIKYITKLRRGKKPDSLDVAGPLFRQYSSLKGGAKRDTFVLAVIMHVCQGAMYSGGYPWYLKPWGLVLRALHRAMHRFGIGPYRRAKK